MDRRGTEANGSRPSRSRRRRGSKMALVLALQNLLVVSCLVLSLYVYWNVHWNVQWDEQESVSVNILIDSVSQLISGDVKMSRTPKK